MLSLLDRCVLSVCAKMGQAHILLRMGRKVEAVDGDEAVLGSTLGVGIGICCFP